MSRLVLLLAVFVGSRAAAAELAPFDVLSCAVTLVHGSDAPAGLGEAPSERGGPPPKMTRFVLHSARELDAATRAISDALPRRWRPHVELDATGMAKVVELHLPGTHGAAELAPSVLAFVRAHACLFGVIDPATLDAHATGPHHDGWIVMIDVRPRSVGAIHAEVEADEHGATRVRIQHHLWPVADPPIAIDPKRLLARYVGRPITYTVLHMRVDPKTHRRLGCVPSFHKAISNEATFHFRAGPILLCKGDEAEVVSGAFVWMNGSAHANDDPVLRMLPAVHQTNGDVFTNIRWIAPALRVSGGDEQDLDYGECSIAQ